MDKACIKRGTVMNKGMDHQGHHNEQGRDHQGHLQAQGDGEHLGVRQGQDWVLLSGRQVKMCTLCPSIIFIIS
jgi:hypothetical protein